MAMKFEELDEVTRRYMLEEFEAEEAGGNPYRGRGLTEVGRAAFPELIRQAIRNGDERALVTSLSDPTYWNPTDAGGRSFQPRDLAERLGLTEFNTWYVRGLAKRLIDEGAVSCQIYRAAEPKGNPRAECSAHEGQVISVEEIYRGHKARYWPAPGDPRAMSIPSGPSCHHTSRRVQSV